MDLESTRLEGLGKWLNHSWRPILFKTSVSVVFPAYNEESNIWPAVALAVQSLARIADEWEVIIVDDGSQDGTGMILDQLAQRFEHIRVVHHPSNQGYGAALRSGIMQARNDLIFFCDSDLQFDLTELRMLAVWIEEYDMVIGYRLNRQDSFHRRLNAWGWNRLVRLLFGLKVKDIDCAFKLFRRSVFDRMKIESVGAMVNTEILLIAIKNGFSIREIPISHFPRDNGKQSGANIRVIVKAFRELFKFYGKLHLMDRDPTPPRNLFEKCRIFLPGRRRDT